MTNWKYRLNLADLWAQKEREEITIFELTRRVGERIKTQSYYNKYQGDLEEIADFFIDLGDDSGVLSKEEATEEFDFNLGELYDWADNVKCWVSTTVS